ncbi:ERF family protein [Streptomyces sp. NPDC050848]|uniref:ERF family protein n=1 Tax=Streptomyces sp. NPDC050848 TaxID=3155791 RepID=UPI0033F78437
MAAATEAPASITAEGPTQHVPNQDQPSVYTLMARVMRDVRNVGKDGLNEHQNYRFRGVDGAIGALAQPLRDHGVFMTPEVLDCESEVRGRMNAVRMRVAFHFYGPAGDRVTAITMGEASDTADKASNKAMSAALKYALIHTFMIPVDAASLDDGDRDHPAGQRSPADAYMQRLRKPAVWNNVTALGAMHTEAKADGLLASTVQGPNGETTLGALIVARGTELKAEAAQREERKAQEAPAAAAQVAAEHNATPSTNESPAPTGQDKTAHVQRLMAQVADPNCWINPLALSQIKGDAEQHQVLDEQVQGPPPGCEWMAFRELIDRRFAELKKATEERDERGAA